MKRLEKGILVTIAPVRLFLEDVEAINEIFKENFGSYKIETDEYELNSLKELGNIKKNRLGGLFFTSSDPHIELTLSGNDAGIYSAKDDAFCAGIVAKLKAILDKRATPLRYFAKVWVVLVACGAWLIFVGIPTGMRTSPYPPAFKYAMRYYMYTGALIGGLLLWVLWQRTLTKKRHSLIYLTTRGSRRGFFARNKDQVLLSLFSAGIGGVITLLVLWVTGNLKFR